jgi:hypothetical protein
MIGITNDQKPTTDNQQQWLIDDRYNQQQRMNKNVELILNITNNWNKKTVKQQQRLTDDQYNQQYSTTTTIERLKTTLVWSSIQPITLNKRLWHVLYGLLKNHLCFYLTFLYYKNLF